MSTVIDFSKALAKRSESQQEETGAVVLWNLSDLAPVRQGSWVRSAVAGTRHEALALTLWRHHPTLRIATERLAQFLTPMWPSSSGGSLLASTVQAAVEAVQKAMDAGAAYEARIIGIYLYQLIECAEEVARLRVYGQTGAGEVLAWRYFSEPLHQWAKRNKLKQLQARQVDTPVSKEEIAGLRTHLVARLADPTDVGYLELHAPRG